MIGNLDGIPLRDRVTANRISIQNEIARRRSDVDDLQKQIDELSAHPTRGSSVLISVLRARIAEHETYVSSYQNLLEKKWEWKDANRQPVSQVGVNVVVFDPTSSAIGSYYGPIDPQTGDIPAWVKHTAVSVPGTGANMADFSESRAQDLYLASGYDSAVFQWAGGAFPQTIPEATQASYSEKLAPRLASFVDSVNVPSGATMTVLGHSYGGATVGLAEKADEMTSPMMTAVPGKPSRWKSPFFISSPSRAGSFDQWNSSVCGSMSSICRTVPVASMNATERGVGVPFIQKTRGASSDQVNSIPEPTSLVPDRPRSI